MPLQATSGTASYDGFGGGAAAVPQYIEDVFSTYLYTGTAFGVSQTVINGIDLSTKGGMVWCKSRSAAYQHYLFDTARGTSKYISSNRTNGQSAGSSLSSFNANGFTLDGGLDGLSSDSTSFGSPYVSWTFRKQPKFFDVVTYTGTGSARTIAHSLNSSVGFMIVKRTDAAADWATWHKSVPPATGNDFYTVLNSTANAVSDATVFNSTAPTSTVFSVGTSALTNASGGTYVAYLFANSSSGGFGLTGADSVIDCGSVSTGSSASRSTVNLGWEPQLILLKKFSGTGTPSDWIIVDNMRDLKATFNGVTSNMLNPNSSVAESSLTGLGITSTGFTIDAGIYSFGTFQSYFYMAIRRPMKTPITGTGVFSPVTRAGTSAVTTVSTSFPVDLAMIRDRSSGSFNTYDRLRGAPINIRTAAQNADFSATNTVNGFDTPTGVILGDDSSLNWVNTTGQNYINYLFKRAPGFMDIVCYTGTGAAMTINHNLGVTPEMAIIKNRSSGTTDWGVWHQSISPSSGILFLNNTAPRSTGYIGTRTSTTFAFSTGNAVTSASGNNYVAYFFATLAGVSKVGTYTGTGTTLQIDCGFTAGARFVLIRRTDATLSGNWYVWDTARGITSGNDPYSLVNTNSAETTTTDYIDPYSAGFEISSTAPAEINGSGNSFIYLAIA